MGKYAKCPRCDLNYVDTTKQQYCDICLKEMKGIIEEDIILDDEEENEEMLCPICGENMMPLGAKMCDECKQKSEYEEEPSLEEEAEKDDEWRTYLDDDTSDVEDIGIEADEIDDDDANEDDYADEEEDFEYVTGEDIYKLGSDDDDDDDEENEDDEF